MADRKNSWNKKALSQLNKAIDYIANDSIQNAEQVRVDILERIKKLPYHPEIYSLDKFKKNNDGNYRAFELHKYRIAYHISSGEIRILHIRHTSMEPEVY